MEAFVMHRSQVRRLSAETLESRSLLAGDVTAVVDGGVLRITGDAASNGVRIRRDGDDLVVVGTLVAGAATTINGSASFTAGGVSNGLVVRLEGGNDVLRLANDNGPLAIDGTITVATGNGNDRVTGTLTNDNTAGFYLGPGADKFGLNRSTLGNLVVNTDPLAAEDGRSDELLLTNVRTTGLAILRTGGGNDRVEIRGASSVPQTLTVATGDGSDRILIEGTTDTQVQVGHALTIESGRGNDEVRLRNLNVNGVLTITNLDGASDVELALIKASEGLFAWLGAGDDDLTIRNSSSARAGLGGGLGSDTLTLEANVFGRLNRVSF
jgi:hypothetical protein